jgi:hypothetical protein
MFNLSRNDHIQTDKCKASQKHSNLLVQNVSEIGQTLRDGNNYNQEKMKMRTEQNRKGDCTIIQSGHKLADDLVGL